VQGRTVEIATGDEVAVLARILNWALESGGDLSGLSVTRTTLEDIYLDLTRSNTDDPEGRDR
jgi:hypothetical protein